MIGSDIVMGTGSCIKPSFEITLYVIYGGVCEYPNVNISPANRKNIYWIWNYDFITSLNLITNLKMASPVNGSTFG